MPLKYEPTRWVDLRTGATILCPDDGEPEVVTRNVQMAGPPGEQRRAVRVDRGHRHTRLADATVPAHNDNGHRDVTYRTHYGTAVATRPGSNAPWWLHLPAGWPAEAEHRPTTRRNGNGAYWFRSQAAVNRFLVPYTDPEPAGEAPDRQPRRQPNTDPLRRGGYT